LKTLIPRGVYADSGYLFMENFVLQRNGPVPNLGSSRARILANPLM